MADGTGDARNEKTPLRGVCGAQNAAAMAFRAAAAPSFRSVTKSARMRTYCTQNGVRRRLARRFSARESGVPHPFTVCLPSRSPLPRFSLRLRRRVAWLYPPAARRSSTRATRGRPPSVPHAERDRLLRQPLFSARGVPRQGGCRSIGAIAFLRVTAAFWPRAAAVSPIGAYFSETAHLQDDRRMGSIVKYLTLFSREAARMPRETRQKRAARQRSQRG